MLVSETSAERREGSTPSVRTIYGRLAQWESGCFTRSASGVRIPDWSPFQALLVQWQYICFVIRWSGFDSSAGLHSFPCLSMAGSPVVTRVILVRIQVGEPFHAGVRIWDAAWLSTG